MFNADSSLLDGTRAVTVEQQRVLLRHGLGQWFWNQPTITGKIEGRVDCWPMSPSLISSP